MLWEVLLVVSEGGLELGKGMYDVLKAVGNQFIDTVIGHCWLEHLIWHCKKNG